MKFNLPLGPSVNAMYRNVPGRGRVKTGVYKAWLTEAGHAMNAQWHGKMYLDEIEIAIQCGKPDRRRQDISNRIKAVEDLLCKHGVIEDDSLVVKVTAEWADVEGAVVEINPA